MRTIPLWAAALAFLSHAAHAASPNMNAEAFAPAIEAYLAEKGHVCLGKFTWPVVVSNGDRQAGTKDAVQMPVLEKLGLVQSSADAAATKYDLSEAGRKYYLLKKTVTLGPGDARVLQPGDLCGAALKLDHVVNWTQLETAAGQAQTTVKYTYRVAEPADWILQPDLNRVFPMVHRVLNGAGSMQLEQTFAWSDGHWTAVVPGS